LINHYESRIQELKSVYETEKMRVSENKKGELS